MSDLSKATKSQLVKRYKALNERHSAEGDKLIAAGFGSVPMHSMRASGHPRYKKYLEIWDEIASTITEAKRRYGPDLIYMEQLLH